MMEEEDQFTSSGVEVTLTQREYFTAPVFSSHDYFSRLSNKILTPVITNHISREKAEMQQLQQQQQQQQQLHGAPKRSHARSLSGGLAEKSSTNQLQQMMDHHSLQQQQQQQRLGADSSNDDPAKVAERLVDLHEEAIEMLEKLRFEEQHRLAETEKTYRITESSVRGKLGDARDEHCVSTVATLDGMESLANAALTITSSVRAEMAAASNRIARGNQILELFEIFDACTNPETMGEVQFQSLLGDLSMLRHQHREAVLAQWKNNNSSSNNAFGGGGGSRFSASYSAAAVHGSLYFQLPMSQQQQQQQQSSSSSAEEGKKNSSSSLFVREQKIVEAGFPEVLARRSRLQDALEVLKRLVPLAESMLEQVPLAANIVEYDAWLKQQLDAEVSVLMIKFSELHALAAKAEADAASSAASNASFEDDRMSVISSSRLSLLRSGGGGAGGAQAQPLPQAGTDAAVRHAESRRLFLLNSVYAKLILASLDLTCRLHCQHYGSHEKLVQVLLEFVVRDLNQSSSQRFKISHAPADLKGSELVPAETKKKKEKEEESEKEAEEKKKKEAALLFPPPARTAKNSEEIAAAFDFFAFELLWNLTMIEAMFGSSFAGVRSKVVHEIVQKVVHDYAKEHLAQSETRRQKVNSVAEKLPSNQARHLAPVVVAELSHHNEFLALILKHVRRLSEALVEKFDDLQSAVSDALSPLFDKFGAAYAKEDHELKFMSRALQNQIESHVRDFAVPVDGSAYDLGSGHEETMKEGFDIAESCLKRAALICSSIPASSSQQLPASSPAAPASPSSFATAAAGNSNNNNSSSMISTRQHQMMTKLSSTLAVAFQSYVTNFVDRELQKAADMMRKDSATWSSWCSQKQYKRFFDDDTPLDQLMFLRQNDDEFSGGSKKGGGGGSEDGVVDVSSEALFCSMRLYRWGLSAMARLSRFCQQFLQPLFAQHPELIKPWRQQRNTLVAHVDRVAGELLTFVSAGIVTRSLAVLSHLQKHNDFLPVETGATADLGLTGTKAAGQFHRFLSFCLLEAEPLMKQLHASAQAAAAARSLNNPYEASSSLLTSANPPKKKSASSSSSSSSGADLQSILGQGRKRRGEALSEFLRDTTMSSSTFVVNISFGLFRGLCCHLRGFTVNDIGVLIMKRDVILYREAASLLFCHALSEEANAIGEMFDFLRELMNLLMVPLDNIRNVKQTGLLRELHPKDIIEFLQMRRDIGKALSESLTV